MLRIRTRRENFTFGRAYESTQEMNVLLKKLFDFSRVESGQLPFHMVKVDLAEFTSAYIAQKEAVTDPKRVQMTFEKSRGRDSGSVHRY